MNDQQRLEIIQEKLRALNGLDADRFRRLSDELQRQEPKFGYDDQGRLRVVMFDSKSYDIESFERSNQERHAIHFVRAALGKDTVQAAAGAKVVCIFVNDECDAEIVQALAKLGVELIALRCAGYNNVDLEACGQYGLRVARVPAYSPYAVAEHTVALMLTLNRRLHQAYQRNRTGYFILEGLTGFDMRGKTVGVVGTGKIGRCTIDILLGFGCKILAFDKYPDDELAAREGVEYVLLDRLWPESDIITLHVPLFPETYHLIDQSTIEQMKDEVMVINTSRGGLVDTRALIDGLKQRKIGSAGLDVYEEEAGVFFHDMSDKVLDDDVLARLMTFNNVVVTSHQGFLTREALGNIADTTIENIDQFKNGVEVGAMTNAVVAQ